MKKVRVLRFLTAAAAVVLIVRGLLVGDFGYGGICNFSATVKAREIWAMCPLGFLERFFASGEWLPRVSAVVLVLVGVVLLGRVYCAWICPTVLLKRVFKDTGRLQTKAERSIKGINWGAYSPYAVLAGALLASFIFKFPVFCFFCPIGLFFGFLFLVMEPLTPGVLRPELLLFPAMLVAEIWVLRSWCRSICPVGALLSIFGNLNRILLPAVKKGACLGERGIDCRVCERECPEGIDLHKIRSSYLPNSCTKCLACYIKCPGHAIELPLLRLR